MDNKEEQEWEQELEEASLTLRRSRFRNGDSVVTDAQHIPTNHLNSNGNSENNGHHKIVVPSNSYSNSATAANDDNNGFDQPVQLLDQEKIAALTHPQVEIHSNKTAVTDSQTKSSTSVYYDPDEGIWKCRICSWTYGTAYLSSDLVQNPKGHLHELMIYKTLDQEKSCYTFDLEGTKLNSTYSGEQHVVKTPGDGVLDISSGDVIVQKDFDTILDSHVDGNKKDYISLSLQHSKILSEEYSISGKPLDKNEIENEDADLINESGLEVTEIDLERVLEKQNTHELFCPNCNSCITRRVILRKRKRGVRVASKDVKRNKLEAAVDSSFTQGRGLKTSNQIHNSAEIYSDDTPELAGNDYDRDRKPDIFRCLSCFSFFIPTGNGFKIFRMFEDKGQTKAVQDQQKSMSKSWISSIFGSHEEPTSEPGRDIRSDGALTTHAESLLPSSNANAQSFSKQKDLSHTDEFEGPVKSGIAESWEDGDKISHNLTKEQLINGKEIPSTQDDSKIPSEMSEGDVTKEQFEPVTGSQTNTSNVPIDVPTGHQSGTVEPSAERYPVINGNLPENVVPVSPPDGLKLLISSDSGLPTSEKLGKGRNPDLTIQNSGKVDIFHEDVLCVGAMIVNNSDGGKSATVKQSNYGGSNLNENSQQTSITNGIYAGGLFKTNKDPLVLSAKDVQFLQGGQANIIKDLEKVTAELTEGKDTIIVVEPERIYKSDSQLSQNLNVSDETGASPSLNTRTSVTDQRGADGRESYRIDIIKSIVFGGLIESIVSLGVVSSAAGGSAATLNVVTLSLANLIGGLVLIFHNLWDLKKDKVSDQQQQQTDRYEERLGRRESFLLHATVVILSFLIFGSVPPITYGLSFRKSNSSRELKILATASAALASVLVLATGKAYVRKPPKSYLKTITYFILMGFMVSGVSYAVGDLLNRLLLEKLHFQSNSHGFLTLPRTTTMTAVDWASY